MGVLTEMNFTQKLTKGMCFCSVLRLTEQRTVCGLTLIIPTGPEKQLPLCYDCKTRAGNNKKNNASKFSLNMKIAAINNLNG